MYIQRTHDRRQVIAKAQMIFGQVSLNLVVVFLSCFTVAIIYENIEDIIT